MGKWSACASVGRVTLEGTFLLLVIAVGLGIWSGYALPFRAVWPISGLAIIAGLAVAILSGIGVRLPVDDGMSWSIVPAVVAFLVGQGVGALKRRDGSPF